MSSRGWWWQRYHPVLRVIVATAYFGAAIALFVFAISPGFRTESRASTISELSAPLTGPAIFEKQCASGQGSTLEGGTGPRLGPGSEADDETDKRLLSRIEDGRKAMPEFSSKLSDSEIQLVFDFIREQQNPA